MGYFNDYCAGYTLGRNGSLRKLNINSNFWFLIFTLWILVAALDYS